MIAKAEAITGAIIKPSGNSCNLACSYCYANPLSPSKTEFMDLELAQKVMSELVNQPDLSTIELIWHGGEPLLRGIDFFDRIIDYQKSITPKGINVIHALQTNSTLLNDEWFAFLKDRNINISTSLDGPKWLHDSNRLTRSGTGSYDMVTENIAKAKEAGIVVNTISVINNQSVRHAKEIYEHLSSLGINHVGFLPCFEMVSSSEIGSATLKPGLFGEFMVEIFDLYFKDPQKANVREFEQIFRFFTDKQLDLCNYNGSCHKFICVSSDGKVYSCDTSPLSEEFQYGNLHTSNLQEVLNGDLRSKAIERTTDVMQSCRNCDYWDGCHGGCPNQRFGGSFYFCRDRRIMFSHIEERLSDLVDSIPDPN